VNIDYKNTNPAPIYRVPLSKNNLKNAMNLGNGSTNKLKDLIGNKKGIFIISTCRHGGFSEVGRQAKETQTRHKEQTNMKNTEAYTNLGRNLNNSGYRTNNGLNLSTSFAAMEQIKAINEKRKINKINSIFKKINKKNARITFPRDSVALKKFMRTRTFVVYYKRLLDAEIKATKNRNDFNLRPNIKKYLINKVKKIANPTNNTLIAEQTAIRFIKQMGLHNA
jgi:hypothetical protein